MRRVVLGLIALAACALVAPAPATGPWRADAGNTRGWQFMTPEERIAHQARIRAFDNYAACRAYRVEHHRVMEERAKQQGRVLEPERRDFCEHLSPAAQAR